MNQNVLVIYKNAGETPLEALGRMKNEHKEWANLPITYAGRLDPMAEGLLLVLVGEECLKKDEYLALSKEYEVEVLFGFATDTFDLLGKVTSSENEGEYIVQGSLAQAVEPSRANFQQKIMCADGNNISSEFSKIISGFTGKFRQAYPPYSSRTVNGKPLWEWAREGRLSEIEIPTHEVFVEKIEIKNAGSISGKKLLHKIETDIGKVKGDFRQEEILNEWRSLLKDREGDEFQTVTLIINCGSGTYVRAIAHELGLALGTPALAMNIKRTKIGDF